MTDRAPIDYVGLNAALLARSRQLVQEWLPEGFERAARWYVGDFHGAGGKSANVALKTGTWIDNGTGEKGGDLISLYACIHGLSNAAAARELMQNNGWQSYVPPPVQTPAKSRKKADVDWTPIHPVPADAPHYTTQWYHYSHGKPLMHWEYRSSTGELLGVVCRFEKSDGTKDVQPLSWCHGSNGRREWRYKAFAQPRPLYGLDRLAAFADRPDVPAVIVEGEKKADRLFEALGQACPVISWPGGCKVPHLADWRPVGRRRCVAWPDADSQIDKRTGEMYAWDAQPGVAAMHKVRGLLAGQGAPVGVVDVGPPGTHPDGWDCADAIADGWTLEQLQAFMRNVEQPALSVVDGGGGAVPPTKAPPGNGGGDDGGDGRRHWRDEFLWKRGERISCVANVMLILTEHEQWKGVLGFDEFAQRVVKRKPAPYDQPGRKWSGEWSDVDDTRTAAWIARHEGFVPHSGYVAEAANVVAHDNMFHPVLDWLETLRWDGTPRLDEWMVDLLGVEDTPYTRLVSRYFLIGMCRRVIEPGCKFDYCLVLEGAQGKRKSTALRILGGDWFSDIELDLQNKDAMSNIRGKWLHEFGEMGSLARSESNRQKSFLSRQVDEFRPTYGRREIRCLRQTAFGGTTNEWQWNKDPTGGRRFWPLLVGLEINTDGLAAVREQLFAEAYRAAQAGERYWPTADQQRDLFDPEQLSREAPEAYVDLLAAWFRDPMNQLDEFSLAQACMTGIGLDVKSLTKDVQTRVGIALRKLECERVEYRNRNPRFMYKRPHRNAASSSNAQSVRSDDEEVPF